MTEKVNIQLIATEIGNIAKWMSSVNEIDRKGHAILKVSKESFPHAAITAVRQQTVYDWLCSLGKAEMLLDERNKRMTDFCLSLADDAHRTAFINILETGGVPANILYKDQLAILQRENLHAEVYKHAKGSFQHEKYAHALLEVCKAYDKAVQAKTGLDNDGRSLMQQSWAWRSNILRATSGNTDSDESYHEGLKLLSEGVMAGVRNIPAHEPVLSWPISKEDCIDCLHLLSFLFRKLEKAVNIRHLSGAGS